MYAVKPWGKVLLVGSTVGSYAMGVGMRWRESNVTVVEKRAGPSYEKQRRRRCVLTDQSIKLLVDLGCTERKLRSAVRPTRGWRFLSPQLEVIREGDTFPGCAVGETSYHCSEGVLLQTLRSEFLRFGGTVTWETEAYDAYENNDGSGTWCLRKDYGLGTGAEAIITTAKGTALSSALITEDDGRIAVLFDVESGVSAVGPEECEQLFGNRCDVAIVIGEAAALHCWLLSEGQCVWRLVRKARKSKETALPGASPIVHHLISSGKDVATAMWVVPATTPAIKDGASHARISVLGDGLLPVDPFEWRGDNARCMIEEASTLCRAFYGKKYHRGDVAFLLRGVEQDSLSKRANLLRRDLLDAEHFLNVLPALDTEQGPAAVRQVGTAHTHIS